MTTLSDIYKAAAARETAKLKELDQRIAQQQARKAGKLEPATQITKFETPKHISTEFVDIIHFSRNHKKQPSK